MNFGNISIIIDDLPIKQHYKEHTFLNQLTEDERYEFMILHTNLKFDFANYLVEKIACRCQGIDLPYDYDWETIIDKIPSSVIDYFVGDYSKWKRVFSGIIKDIDMLNTYNNRLNIIRA